jgi:hypothetical protein
MDQQPSPAQARPSAVTAVAVLMFIAGGFGILGGFLAVAGGGYLVGFGGTGALIVFGLLALVIGAVQIWAGLGIMKLREQARMVGLVITVAGAVLTVIGIASGGASGVVSLAIDAFIIWTLYTNKELFS